MSFLIRLLFLFLRPWVVRKPGPRTFRPAPGPAPLGPAPLAPPAPTPAASSPAHDFDPDAELAFTNAAYPAIIRFLNRCAALPAQAPPDRLGADR